MNKYLPKLLLVLVLVVVLVGWFANWQWTTAVNSAAATQSEQSGQARSTSAKIESQYMGLQQSLNLDETEATAAQLKGFIERYPAYIQPYLDLAAHYANAAQLSAARLTLIQGLNSDPQTALLQSNLQKVQGALAANAYKAALDDDADVVGSLVLPTVVEVAPTPAAPQ